MNNTLYICYFGVREPLVQTQVIPYLLELSLPDDAEAKIIVSLLTFEPKSFEYGEEDAIREELAGKDITWHCLTYHKRFSVLATLYDIAAGALHTRKLMRREPFDILHARVHVPMLMAAIARKISWHKPKILFDIRGFFPEEYVDAGVWPANGWLFGAVKRVEKWLMKEADGFVVLTEKAREILFGDTVTQIHAETVSPKSKVQNPKGKKPPAHAGGYDLCGRPVEVIPCCVDLRSRFSLDWAVERAAVRGRLGIGERFVLTHVGALGGLYLTENIADFLSVSKENNPLTFALFLTQSDPAIIIPLLRERGFTERDFLVTRVPPVEVPRYLAASDVGLSFVKSSFATLSRSPTKIPEYLACGLPVVANDGVGDTTELTMADRTGVVIREFTPEAYGQALDELDKMMADGKALSDRCRTSARKRFDLETVGGVRYRRLYSKLTGKGT